MARLHAVPALHVVLGMLGSVEGTVGADEHMAAYPDVALVEHQAVVVDEGMLANDDAAAVVAMEGRVNLGGGGEAGDEVFYHLAIVLVVYGHRLQLGAECPGVFPTVSYLWRSVVVELLVAHLV